MPEPPPPDATPPDPTPPDPPPPRATRWLSQGFEVLQRELPEAAGDARRAARPDIDIVIVGSGYGGALAARELAGNRDAEGRLLSVCVLERGNEYLPGMFPSELAELPGFVRASVGRAARPLGNREGLFDLRLGADVSALVANGLGGGSLINAGVMLRPDAPLLADPAWPASLREGGLSASLDEAERLLGAQQNSGYTLADGVPDKTFALRRLAPGQFRAASLTIALADKVNQSGVALRACIGCGDCATGCNHQAKESLDTNLLVDAQRRGARLFTGVTVLRLERDGAGGWSLVLVPTDHTQRTRDGRVTRLRAGKVILAAGTFGSTEILLRSASDHLAFSRRLGQRFSANGDMLAVVHDQTLPANAFADDADEPAGRRIGPTITGLVDLRDEPDPSGEPLGLVLQDLAIPGALRRLYEESTALALALHRLPERDDSLHTADTPAADPCAIDRAAMRRTLPVAILGRDSAAGAIELVRGTGDADDEGDGAVAVRWPRLRDEPLFQRQIDALQALVTRSATGGRVLPNPMWRPLPRELDFLFGGQLGPPLTVHPLGGCVMADHPDAGVVDALGRVYDGLASDPMALLPGLVVLDGSVIPLSLGINPALTIAAVSLHALRGLQRAWALQPWQQQPWQQQPWQGPQGYAPPPPRVRPVYRVPAVAQRVPTVVRSLERLSGPVVLTGADGREVRCQVEITLPFEPVALDSLMTTMRRELRVDVSVSGGVAPRLRVFRQSDWDRITSPRPSAARASARRRAVDSALDEVALLIAPLSGTLRFLHREASTPPRRVWRAWIAWLFNRGARDAWQWWRDGRAAHSTGQGADYGPPVAMTHPLQDALTSLLPADLMRRLRSSLDLASRAGEVRRFDYELVVGAPSLDRSAALLGAEGFARVLSGVDGAGAPHVTGHKRITYDWLGNPWEQLATLTLETFPLMPPAARPLLALDLKFLARQQVPLLQVVSRRDEVSLIVDLLSFGLYLLRVLIDIHAWSFRRPDSPSTREPQRLPGALRTLPWGRRLEPRITELLVDRLPDGTPVHIRLTRYPRLDSVKPPVLMIHGYSASGTTFAHPTVSPNLASFLHARGRDVWLLDLRTSSGMPTARWPWSYEETALRDIPAAVEHVVNKVGQERSVTGQRIDVVAHCMGAAMFSMALLAPPQAGEAFFRERERLPSWIRRVVLSQIGPVMVFSPANIFRAYLMRWLLQLLPRADYAFRPRDDAGLLEQLLDRLLTTLPYPPQERRIENPLRFWRSTPYAGTRHRMDALYGRSFSLANLSRRTRDAIDDLFGPLAIGTVAQTIHFAQRQVITNRRGRNVFVSRENLRRRWGGIATLSLHGMDNGLADAATLARMQAILRHDARLDVEFEALAGFGHQDTLIGRRSAEVFARIEAFLLDQRPPRPPSRGGGEWFAQVPWIGPVVGPLRVVRAGVASLTVSASAHPSLGRARCAAIVAVCREQGGEPSPEGDRPARRWRMADAGGRAIEAIALPPDVDGWLNLDVRLDGWPTATEGVLVLLLYEQSAQLDQSTMPVDEVGGRVAPMMTPMNTPTSTPTSTAESPGSDGPPASAPVRVRPAPSAEQRIEVVPDAVLPAGERPSSHNPRLLRAVAHALEQTGGDELEQGCIDLLARRRVPYEPLIRFAFGGCQYPAGMLVEAIAQASYERLRADAAGPRPPRALLLLGDQIYSDATAGLFDPSDADARDIKPYERLFRIPALRWLLRHLPVYMMLDDHELIDNWEPARDGSPDGGRLQAGRAGYLKYQRCAGPPPVPPRADSTQPLWYTFEVDGLPFL